MYANGVKEKTQKIRTEYMKRSIHENTPVVNLRATDT
jgi:hypothetical protein